MGRQRGFTLIEVLVATAIAAVVLTTVYGIFTAVSKARQRVEIESETSHRARVIFDRVGRELRGTFRATPLLFTVELDGEQRPVLTFATASATLGAQGRGGVAAVRYSLVEDEREPGGRLLALVRSETPLAAGSDYPPGMLLCGGIHTLTWRVFADNNWHDTWNATQTGKFPERVELNLVMVAGGMEVPFRSAFEVPRP